MKKKPKEAASETSGERKTKQRDAIKGAFEASGRPLSPQEVFEIAQTNAPGLGIATVYRAIKELTERGELSTVELPGGSIRYEASGKDHHHHFHCRGCDRVYEVESCSGKINVGAPRGFVTERHEVVLHGLCVTCK